MRYYIVDAFTDKLFSGNPAGVCILEKDLPDETLQKIAFENNLAETAFLQKKDDCYTLRWFTPEFEIDLCGHATLAAAYVVLNFIEPEIDAVSFSTMSGILSVQRENGSAYEMSLPTRKPQRIEITKEISEALGIVPIELYSERDLYAFVENESMVLGYEPDYDKLRKLNKWLGIVVTALGDNSDFVSRYFCPELGLEDAVTGSSHCCLVPLWSSKLNKTVLFAKQISKRRGTLYCKMCENEVKVSGKAVLYLQGEIKI